MNFLNYTQNVEPTAGFSAGIINQRVSNIDGRDADGYHTETYSTTENQVYFSFGNRISRFVSLGVSSKLYYAKLFEKMSSTTVGFDVGLLIRPKEMFAIGFVAQDLGSKYLWDSKPLYQENGRPSKDKFPTLQRLSITYNLPSQIGIVSFEWETSNHNTSILRGGIEVYIEEHFVLRGGFDRYDLKDEFAGAKPTFGFSLYPPFEDLKTTVHYAYLVEPFSPAGAHILAISFFP